MLIKIKVSGAATTADQPRIKRDPNGVNRGRVLSYATLFCAENRQNIATYHRITVFKDMAWARAYSGGFNNRGAIADFIDMF
jgi:hypothetical protein